MAQFSKMVDGKLTVVGGKDFWSEKLTPEQLQGAEVVLRMMCAVPRPTKALVREWHSDIVHAAGWRFSDDVEAATPREDA